MKRENLLKKYVPRHFRLGVCTGIPEIESFQETVEEVPILDASGCPVRTERIIKRVSSDENMDKYRLSAFRLSALVSAGVPMSMVNINSSTTAKIEDLVSICKSLDGAEKYVEMLENQRKERESWFVDSSSSVSESKLNEIY